MAAQKAFKTMCTPDPHAAPRASSAAELDFQRADCAFRLGLDGSLRLGLDGSLHPALGDVPSRGDSDGAGPAHGSPSPVARPVHHGLGVTSSFHSSCPGQLS